MSLGGLLVLYAAYRVIAPYLRDYIRRRRESGDESEEESSEEEEDELVDEMTLLEQDPHDLWARATRLAREGRFRQAVRELYLTLLLLLHQGGTIAFEPGLTNWEYLRDMGRKHPSYDGFRKFTGFFDLVWYGGRGCSREEYGEFEELARAAAPTIHKQEVGGEG